MEVSLENRDEPMSALMEREGLRESAGEGEHEAGHEDGHEAGHEDGHEQTGTQVVDAFLRSVAAAASSALLLDFDGTLAPFRVDPATVRPWAGVTALLEAIQASGRTRLAIVTGRPAEDVAAQLGMRTPPEIWGLHGAERRSPAGGLMVEQLSARQHRALEEARRVVHAGIQALGVDLRTEDKANAVVVHWRGKPARTAELARQHLLALVQPLAASHGMKLLQFDGGLELRAGRDKGDAVRQLLSELQAGVPVAYLGDDVTDEDAFEALGKHGLSVLVRRAWRPGAAQAWLRPPHELRAFLRAWLRVAQGGTCAGFAGSSAPDA